MMTGRAESDNLPGEGVASAITCGRSKLMPLIEGYFDTIILSTAPVPPPTSTTVLRPWKPSYVSRIFFMKKVEWLNSPLLKTWLNLGSVPW